MGNMCGGNEKLTQGSIATPKKPELVSDNMHAKKVDEAWKSIILPD